MKGFPFLIKFSYRNLWRSPKRTMLMLMSLSVGSAFIIWNLNFASSGSKEVMKSFLAQYAGQYHLTHPDFYTKGNTREINYYKTISDELIPNQDIIKNSARRVVAPVFISGQKKTVGVLLTGLDVLSEIRLSKIKDSITTGSFLSPIGKNEIILGKRLSEKLDVKIGDEVGVIGQSLDGSVANDLFRVVGLLDFGGGELEDSLVFTQLFSAQELLVMPPESFHQRVSFIPQAASLHFSGVKFTPWNDILPEISVSITFVDNFTWVVSVIIVLVISLGLANSLMITFLEREKEFQSLNIIGAKTSWVATALLIEVFIMGAIALLVGVTLGHFVTMYFSHYPINVEAFTGGKKILMGGMVIDPLVRFYPVSKYYWQVPILIFSFLGLTMTYPLIRVINRSKHAI